MPWRPEGARRRASKPTCFSRERCYVNMSHPAIHRQWDTIRRLQSGTFGSHSPGEFLPILDVDHETRILKHHTAPVRGKDFEEARSGSHPTLALTYMRREDGDMRVRMVPPDDPRRLPELSGHALRSETSKQTHEEQRRGEIDHVAALEITSCTIMSWRRRGT